MPNLVIAEIASALHVSHVLTPMSEVRRFTRIDGVELVKSHLATNMFDFTPIFPISAHQPAALAERAGADGILRRSDLSQAQADEPIERFVRPLASDVLIEAKASLSELIKRFRVQPFMFVVGGGGLEGVVTPSDLNKQAGRTQLFMQVCALELALADIVRSSARSKDQLLALLPEKRARAAAGRYGRQRDQDEAADLVAAFDLQDLLYLAKAWAGGDSALSGLTVGQIEQLSKFRNAIMHAVLEPASDDELRVKHLLDQTELLGELLAPVQGPGDGRSAR